MKFLFKSLLIFCTLLSAPLIKADTEPEHAPCLLFCNLIGVPSLKDNTEPNKIRCLTDNIYFEARNQSTAGQLAVAAVTFNRVASERFPNSICEVVFQGLTHEETGRPLKNKCQFSWYCDDKPDSIGNLTVYFKISHLSKTLVNSINERVDITDGATHYHHHSISPTWSKSMTETVRIDEHVFYKDSK